MELDSRQTIIIAILVLYLGRFLDRKFTIFRKFNIPEAVTGGTAIAVIITIIYLIFTIEFEFDLYYRDVLLIIFFTTIGLSTKWQTFVKGGRLFLIMMVLATLYLFIQNIVGILSILPFENGTVYYGLFGGSIPLSGGHGTTIAWAPIFVEEYDTVYAMEFGIIVATFGLIAGGVVAGPVSNWLIKRYNLKSDSTEPMSIGRKHQTKILVNVDTMLKAILYLALGVGLGGYIQILMGLLDLNLPLFVASLLGGMILTNVVPLILPNQAWPDGSPTLAMVSEISLGVFLAMSLMSIKLWEVTNALFPVALLLSAQVIVIVLFTVFVLFRALGKNYDAAVMSAGYIGLGLGATPVALANMTAVSKKYGPSPIAFVMIPIIGAFFINFVNALVIEVMLRLIG